MNSLFLPLSDGLAILIWRVDLLIESIEIPLWLELASHFGSSNPR
jgi:hypothetical protein